jgi:hypothetical protein
MDRDTFIITVFCLVSNFYAQVTARRAVRDGGFAPALSDEQVITMEICGASFKLQTDKDLYNYFAAHYHHFFPLLPNRSLFVRQAANLWQVKSAIWQSLVERSGQSTSPAQVIETLAATALYLYSRSARPVFQNLS